MNEQNTDVTPPEERELVITRVIDAPREMVFKAWTDPEQLKQWWGPHGMTTPVCEMDLKPGGIFHTVMRALDGAEYDNTGVFLEVAKNERLVFTDAYQPGWILSQEPFMTVIVTFKAEGGKTNCTATARHWTVENREKHEQMGFSHGWGEMLERLETLVTNARS